MEKTQFKVISLEKNFYMKPDEYLNGWARKTGWKAGIVYDSLWRHADRAREAFPSIELMAEEWNVDRKTIMKGLQTLIDFNIIRKESKRSKTGKFLHNTYLLLAKECWSEPSPSQGHGLTKSFSGTHHVLHKDSKGTHITKPIKKIREKPIVNNRLENLDKKLSFKKSNKTRKPWELKPYGVIRVSGDPGKFILPSLPEKLDQQEAFDIALEYKVSTSDVKQAYKSMLLSIETGNKYNITSTNYLSELRKWVANGINRGSIEVLQTEIDIQFGILDWSPEAIEQRKLNTKKMKELGL